MQPTTVGFAHASTLPATRFLGLDLHKESGKLIVNQPEFIKKILTKFRMEFCNPTFNPMDPGTRFTFLNVANIRRGEERHGKCALSLSRSCQMSALSLHHVEAWLFIRHQSSRKILSESRTFSLERNKENYCISAWNYPTRHRILKEERTFHNWLHWCGLWGWPNYPLLHLWFRLFRSW